MGNISKTSTMCFEVSNIQTNNHSIVFGIIESLLRPIRRILVQVPSSAFEMLCSAGGSCSFVGSPPLATLSRSPPRHVCQRRIESKEHRCLAILKNTSFTLKIYRLTCACFPLHIFYITPYNCEMGTH